MIAKTLRRLALGVNVVFEPTVQSYIETAAAEAKLGPATVERGDVNHLCDVFCEMFGLACKWLQRRVAHVAFSIAEIEGERGARGGGDGVAKFAKAGCEQRGVGFAGP